MDISEINLHGVIILVAEDDHTSYEIFEERLGDKGAKVIEARDGVEALELIPRERPHFVITDINMPRMDGLTLLGKIYNTHSMKHIPVIVLTGNGEEGLLGRVIDMGAWFYIEKPITPKKLNDMMLIMSDHVKSIG